MLSPLRWLSCQTSCPHLAPKGLLALLAPWGLLDLLAHKEPQVRRGHRAALGRQARLGLRVLQVQQEPLVQQEQQGRLAHQGHRVRLEPQALLALKAQREPQAHKVRSALLDRRETLAQQGPLAQLVARVLRGQQAPRVSREIQAPLGLQAQKVQPQLYLAPQGQQVLQGQQEHKAQVGRVAPKEHKELRVLLAQLGQLAPLGLRVT